MATNRQPKVPWTNKNQHETYRQSTIFGLVYKMSTVTAREPGNSSSKLSEDQTDFLGRIFGSEAANRRVLNPPFCRQPVTDASCMDDVPAVSLEVPSLETTVESLFSDPNRFQNEVRKREENLRLAQIKSQELVATATKKRQIADTDNAQNRLKHTKADTSSGEVQSPSTAHLPGLNSPTPPGSQRGHTSESMKMSVLDRRKAHQQISQSLLARLTITIPSEFTGAPMNLHRTENRTDNDDSDNDQIDIQRGVLRNFTRHADMVLRRDGVVLLHKSTSNDGSIFPVKLINDLGQAVNGIQAEVVQRLDEMGKVWSGTLEAGQAVDASFSYSEVASRCLGRLDIRYKMNQLPFCHPDVLNNPWLMPLIESILGDSAKLVYAGLILSFPGSLDQPWHQDGHLLFPEQLEGDQKIQELPPYALNVFVPVTSINLALGPTEFWVGSHKESKMKSVQKVLSSALSGTQELQHLPNLQHPHVPTGMVAPVLSKGDVLIYDYRTCHRGTQNLSQTVRPMLYLMYARPWFAEHVNFGTERLFPDSV